MYYNLCFEIDVQLNGGFWIDSVNVPCWPDGGTTDTTE